MATPLSKFLNPPLWLTPGPYEQVWHAGLPAAGPIFGQPSLTKIPWEHGNKNWVLVRAVLGSIHKDDIHY